MGSMGQFLNLAMTAMLAAAGVYALYTVIRLQREYVLFDNLFLYPANCRPGDCRDVAGFILYITPRLWIFGILCLVLAAVTLLARVTGWLPLPDWAQFYVLPFAGIGLFAWYIAVNSRCAKKFW